MSQPRRKSISKRLRYRNRGKITTSKISKPRIPPPERFEEFLTTLARSMNTFRLPILTIDGLRKQLDSCAYNTISKMPIPRRYLYPGCRRYVFLASDVMEYFKSQPTQDFIDTDFLNS